MHVQDKNHMTPLHLASLYGNFDVAEALLGHGANVNLEDTFCQTPLHLVAGGDSSDNGPDGARVAKLLLEHGADVNAQDKDNTTPLHSASYCGRAEIARVLLDRGANTSAKTALDLTPLHMVSLGAIYSQEGGVSVARLLLEHGADVYAQDSNGATPLDFASRYELEIASLLLRYGDNTDAKIDQGRTSDQLESGVHPHDKPTPST